MTAFLARYGGACRTCGIARDYHGTVAAGTADHDHVGPSDRLTTCRTCGERVRYIGSHAMRVHAPYAADAATLSAAIAAATGRTIPAE